MVASTGNTLHRAPPDIKIFFPLSFVFSYTVTLTTVFASFCVTAAKYAAVNPAAPEPKIATSFTRAAAATAEDDDDDEAVLISVLHSRFVGRRGSWSLFFFFFQDECESYAVVVLVDDLTAAKAQPLIC